MINKTARTLILLILALAIGLTFYRFYFAKDEAVVAGKPAPPFTLSTLTGEAISLQELQGKGILLNFWGWWCEPCKTEMPYLSEAHLLLADAGVMVVGVHIGGSPFEVETFLEQVPVHFPILHDEKRDVTGRYQIGPIPTTFLIDAEGNVVEKRVTVYTSVEQVVQDLERIKPE